MDHSRKNMMGTQNSGDAQNLNEKLKIPALWEKSSHRYWAKTVIQNTAQSKFICKDLRNDV